MNERKKAKACRTKNELIVPLLGHTCTVCAVLFIVPLTYSKSNEKHE